VIKRLLLITSAVFILLGFLIILTQTVVLIVSLACASALAIYLLAALSRTGKKKKSTRHLPFIIFFALAIIPITLAVLYALEEFNSYSVYSIVIAFGMMLTFMYSLFNLPLTIYHKKLERDVRSLPLKSPPLVSIIIPAYNEERTIDKTLRSVIEADYPFKEVIVVDDGSTDNTYAVAARFKNNSSLASRRFKMLRKEHNRGKSSAINYGIKFAAGKFIIVIDADSIVGRDSIKELVRYFYLHDVVAVGGNIKVLNRTSLLTWCQALEYLIGINLFKRAFDVFGVVMVVPGPLGGFRKDTLDVVGGFDRDTVTEDFDATVKVLKTGKAVQASSDALCYTEAPTSVKSLYLQRLRWNRGNLQTMLKHRDVVTNSRYGMLQQYGYPLVFFTMLTLPFLGMVVAGFIVVAIILGLWFFVLVTFLIFTGLELLLSAIAVVMDREDWKLLLFAPLLVIGYKQLLDFFVIKSVFDVLLSREGTKWTWE
jgi:cellulose synthase/poly-beta-1,6-N-acetylglucosamine synthase-like glycosyltransferase